MRSVRFAHDVDYSVRSVAVIRKHGEDNAPAFEVVCYGVPVNEMYQIREDYSRSHELYRALERRGINPEVWRPNIFEIYEPNDKFKEG